MKRLVLLYLFLVGAIYLGLHIQKDPGYVLISIGHWTIETPLWVTLTILLLCFFVIYFLLGTAKRVSRLGGFWQRFRERLTRRRSHNRTKAGLIAYSEGKWEEAETQLLKALPGSKTPLINYLVSARAAEAQGHSALRDQYLRSAAEIIPEADMAVGITQTELQLDSHQYEQAHATLTHLHQVDPKHPYVLTLLLKLYLKIEDWKALKLILPQLRRYTNINETELQDIERRTHIGLLKHYGVKKDIEALQDTYHDIPRYLKHHVDITYLYADYLNQNNESATAENVLRHAIKKTWHDKLVKLYGSLKTDKANKQLHFLEQQLSTHEDNPALLLALGQLSFSLKLWGKSRNYLEKSARLCDQPETRFELGRLLQTLDEHHEAEEHFKQGLEQLLKVSQGQYDND